MTIFTAWLRAALSALLGAATDAFRDWRRDRDLKRLGYERARRETQEAHLELEREIAEIAARHSDTRDAARRLRDGDF